MYRIGQKEIDAVAEAIKTNSLFKVNNGLKITERTEAEMREMFQTKHALLMTSGHAALTSALIGMGIGPGDEVIVPAYTYISSAMAVVAAGAIPIIAEVDETLTISPEDVLKKLYFELKLGTANSGIAFTLPITAATSFLLSVLDRTSDKFQLPPERKDEHGMSEVKYSMIVTLVNQGFSDNVMDAARAVGAGGGTIIHTRQAFSEETVKRLGIEIHDEKELVIIIADNESKTKIMQAIGESCGIKPKPAASSSPSPWTRSSA